MSDETPPRARVYCDFIGWNVKVTGEHIIRHAHWTWREALDFANLRVRLRRIEWYARGCNHCHGRGYLPDWSHGLDPVYGEPGKKACPDCQPKDTP
jgi:hypothetical protein